MCLMLHCTKMIMICCKNKHIFLIFCFDPESDRFLTEEAMNLQILKRKPEISGGASQEALLWEILSLVSTTTV